MPTKQCEHCGGTGLIRKNIQNPPVICKCGPYQTCYLCENSKRTGLYKECPFCWGTGEHTQCPKKTLQTDRKNKD